MGTHIKTLGKKYQNRLPHMGFYPIPSVLLVLSILLAVFHEQFYELIIALVVGLISLYFIIEKEIYEFKPDILLSYDMQHIYIHQFKRKTQVLITDLKDVRIQKVRKRGDFTYGTLILTTQQEKFSITWLLDIESVVDKLNQIMKP